MGSGRMKNRESRGDVRLDCREPRFLIADYYSCVVDVGGGGELRAGVVERGVGATYQRESVFSSVVIRPLADNFARIIDPESRRARGAGKRHVKRGNFPALRS